MWRMISCYFFHNSFTTFAYNSITMITNFNLTTESAAHLCCFFFLFAACFLETSTYTSLGKGKLT